jgi:hypothetical protein
MTRFSPVNERSTAKYTAVLQDQDGNVVPASALSTFLLTLYDKVTGTVINGRSLQNVLNTNGVSIDGSGNLTWTMDPADNAIVTDANTTEVHVATFQGTFGSGKQVTHDVAITVRNLRLT